MSKPRGSVGFGRIGRAKPSKSLENPPVPRKMQFEQMLCEAIRTRVVVLLRYQKPDGTMDYAARRFGPSVVFWSEQSKVCVTGEELGIPLEPKNFEIGRIIDLRLTTDRYDPSGAIDYTQSKYRNGIICRR